MRRNALRLLASCPVRLKRVSRQANSCLPGVQLDRRDHNEVTLHRHGADAPPCTIVRAALGIGMRQNIVAMHLVVQGLEAEARFFLPRKKATIR